MTEGGPPPGMSFPQKIRTDDDDFVMEMEESMASPPDGYGMDDRSRCKRRKRCGQCGPCQVKENCMKCHFCIRKDVLKQTCIYRKCVYLRSKPKPYSRPHQSPQDRTGRISPARELSRSSPAVKSPPATVQSNMQAFSDQGMQLPDPRPDNPFFPPHLPQQQPMGTLQNNGYVSPPNPMMGRSSQPSLHPSGGVNSSVNMNMQMNMTPQLQNHATSPPVQKVRDQTSPVVPQPVNTPTSAISGIPQVSTCGNIPHIPSIPPVVPAIPPVLPPMTNSSLSGMPPIPSIPNMTNMNERAINDFRHPEQLSIPPHHPHPHFPSVAQVHPHAHIHREANLFGDHSRVPPHMNYPNHVDSLSRGPNDSSCMYHPGLPYSMPGHYQPSGPSFFSGAADINPFRSNFLNSFPPGYSYPPDRYREGLGSLPFSRLGMSSSTSFPQYPSQGAGYGMGNSLSNQYSPYNSQHGCPKNGSRPPVSPSTDDVKVLQEGYINSETSSKSKSQKGTTSQCGKVEEKQEGVKMPKRRSTPGNDGKFCVYSEMDRSLYPVRERSMTDQSPFNHLDYYDMPEGMGHLKSWFDFYNQRQQELNGRIPTWEPWKSPNWFSPRQDDVRSRASTSTLSSDFECEVIGIDDHQVSALIRSDGCNSFEIEFENKSICGSEDASPRKLASRNLSSDFLSPDKISDICVGEKGSFEGRRLFLSPPLNDTYRRVRIQGCAQKVKDVNETHSDLESHVSDKTSVMGRTTVSRPARKCYFREPVCLRQDLGEEGIVQLELPGDKVSIQNVILDEELINKSSNVDELRDYLNQTVDFATGLKCVV